MESTAIAACWDAEKRYTGRFYEPEQSVSLHRTFYGSKMCMLPIQIFAVGCLLGSGLGNADRMRQEVERFPDRWDRIVEKVGKEGVPAETCSH